MSEHRYDIRISESCVDPNPLMVERQDPDNFTRFQARERCALEIAAYVFKCSLVRRKKCTSWTDHTKKYAFYSLDVLNIHLIYLLFYIS